MQVVLKKYTTCGLGLLKQFLYVKLVQAFFEVNCTDIIRVEFDLSTNSKTQT